MEWSYDDKYFACARNNDFSNNNTASSIIESNNGIVVDTISWEPIDEYIMSSFSNNNNALALPNYKKYKCAIIIIEL